MEASGAHAGGRCAGVTEGQGHGVNGPAGGVGPLKCRGQDRKAAFSQDSCEEGESGERRSVSGRTRRRSSADRGGQALAG